MTCNSCLYGGGGGSKKIFLVLAQEILPNSKMKYVNDAVAKMVSNVDLSDEFKTPKRQ